MERQDFGQAGHFVAANKCRFHLHTHARGYCISTVGEYFTDDGFYAQGDMPGDNELVQVKVGSDLYETMVFELGSNGDHNAQPLYTVPWPSRAEANAGHEHMLHEVERERMPRDPKVTLCQHLVEIPREKWTYATKFWCALELGHMDDHLPGRAK